MPAPRLFAPAIVTSTIVLVLCAVGWGALGVVSVDDSASFSPDIQRYLCLLLVTVTICSTSVNLLARFARVIRAGALTDDGYAAGYADGLAAAPVSPAVSRLAPARR
jgi:hypothetical protein